MNLQELEKVFNNIREEEKEQANLLMKELAFTIETAEKLKKEIQENGPTEHFINGKQDFLRENPSLVAYNKLMKTYNTLFTTLKKLEKTREELADTSLEDYDLSDDAELDKFLNWE